MILQPVRQGLVITPRLGVRGILDDCLAHARRLAQGIVLADDHGQNLAGESPLQGRQNVTRQLEVRIVQRRQQMTGDGPAEAADHPLDRLPLPLRALEREIARLDGDHRLPRRPQGIERQQPDHRRAVNDAAVIVLAELPDHVLEPAILVRLVVKPAPGRLQRRQAHRARGQVEVPRDLPYQRGAIEIAGGCGQHRIADRELDAILGHAESRGAVRLRIDVHEQGAQAAARVDRREVDRAGGLATSTFLIDDGDGPHGAVLMLGAYVQ